MKNNYLRYLVASFVLLISGMANAGVILAVNNTDDTLVSIDTDTFAVSTIGSLGTNVSFGGLAYDFLSDTLYLAGGRGNDNLYRVNKDTGAATLIGSHGIDDLFGIAFDTSNNTLFGTQFSSGSGLFTLDTTNGSASTIAASMVYGIGGLTYNHVTDELVGMNDGAGDIYAIDRENGAQSLIHNGSRVNDSGFTFDADKNLYWDIDYDGSLYSYDISNGYARTTHLTGLGRFDGAVYLNSAPQNQPPTDVPEPSTIAFLAFGLLGLGARKFTK